MGWYRADVLGTRVAFTDRRGGVSATPFDSLNLSTSQDSAGGDRVDAVAENRRRALMMLGGDRPIDDWVPIHQVHGGSVVRAAEVPRGGPPVDADAVVVATADRVGAVLVADCAPLALVGRGIVAAVHGGWRGLLADIVAAAARALTEDGAPPEAALLGPCIHPCCYEFGAGDLDLVAERFGRDVVGATTTGAPALDLPAVVRVALREIGVRRVSEVDVCTSCSPDYFSFRRDGRTGRQALLVSVPA